MFGYGYNNLANQAITNELVSDLWIQRNIPGGLNSKFFAVNFSKETEIMIKFDLF